MTTTVQETTKPDEQDDDTHCEADGPEAWAGNVLVFAARVQVASNKYHSGWPR